MLSVTAVLLGLGIHKYQDQIQELSTQVTQPIKGAFGVLGLHLGEAKDMILVYLDDLKDKFMSLTSAISSTAKVQDNGASTSTSTPSIVDRIKGFVPNLSTIEEESGE